MKVHVRTGRNCAILLSSPDAAAIVATTQRKLTMTSLIAGMDKYRPDPAAPGAIAISCDCDKCKAEQLTADYWTAIDETFVAYRTGRLDLAGFEQARFTIHTTYREAVYGLGV